MSAYERRVRIRNLWKELCDEWDIRGWTLVWDKRAKCRP